MKKILKVIFGVSTVSFVATLVWFSRDGSQIIRSGSTSVIPSFRPATEVHKSLEDKRIPKNISLIDSLSTSCVSNKQSSVNRKSSKINKAGSFEQALNITSDGKKNVILSVVDQGLTEFAVNFYVSSVVKLHLINHLFVCLDFESQTLLLKSNIPCFKMSYPFEAAHLMVANSSNQHISSDFGSVNYYMKTNMKTWVVLQALLYGYNVLMSDLDIVLLKDPFQHFSCVSCDVHVSMDRVHRNTGFVYVRATELSIQLYQTSWNFFLKYHKAHDQAYFKMAVSVMQENQSALTIHELSAAHFPCGYYYFQADFRMFNNSPVCQNCVIIHNNYIGSTAAKRYRFKENLLWHVDIDKYYCVDNTVKFLLYENQLVFEHETYRFEMQALMNAMMLGEALGRVVILPTFHCCYCSKNKCDHPKHKCSLLSLLNVRDFDSEYKGRYREHVFLHNKLVPAELRNSKPVELHLNITTENHRVMVTNQVKTYHNNSVFVSRSPIEDRKNLLEILQAFDDVRILKFSALYGDFRFLMSPKQKFFYKMFGESVFRCADYDQFDGLGVFTDTRPIKNKNPLTSQTEKNMEKRVDVVSNDKNTISKHQPKRYEKARKYPQNDHNVIPRLSKVDNKMSSSKSLHFNSQNNMAGGYYDRMKLSRRKQQELQIHGEVTVKSVRSQVEMLRKFQNLRQQNNKNV